MKIFILAARENWITDRLEAEWIKNNKELYTQNIQEADIIWILSNYRVNQIPIEYYKQKKVITTIHHVVPWKMDEKLKNHYKYLDKITDVFHVICDKTKIELSKYITKPIIVKLFWAEPKEWFQIKGDKSLIKTEFNINNNEYLIGSFQSDTEGASIANGSFIPKLEKGPDNLLNVCKLLKNNYNNLAVILTGKRRHYLKREFEKLKIKYYYFEMLSLSDMNKLYNILDLYVVSSRVEGQPRAIVECALSKCPIISTNVGVSEYILSLQSIYDMNNIESCLKAKPDIEIAYKNIQNYIVPNYFKEFNKIFN